MLRRIVLSLIATKNYNKVTRHVVSLKPSIVARCFHVIPSYRSNCDFGSPCNCTECREDARRPVCEVCQVRPTVNQSSELSRDRKGISSYTFTSFCEQCWEKYTGEKRKREQEIEQTLASRKNKVDEMIKYVRGLNSTEQVPIGYAVEKLMKNTRSGNSQRWHQRDLISCLSQDLQIVKVRNRSYLETETTIAGLEVWRLRLLYANRYTSKEVWKRDGEGTVWRELIWGAQDGFDSREDVVHHEDPSTCRIFCWENTQKCGNPCVEHFCIIT